VVQDEVSRGGRVDDHDDLVELAAVDSEEVEIMGLLLRRLLLGGRGSGRGRDLASAPVRRAVEPRGARSAARRLGLVLGVETAAPAVTEEVAAERGGCYC
jgi:hypothetical protein